MFCTLLTLEYVPSGHGVGAGEPWPQYDPAGHGMPTPLLCTPSGCDTSTPLWHTNPAAQAPVVAVRPADEQYWPARHCWQSVEYTSPPTLSNVPLGHLGAELPLPAGQ